MANTRDQRELILAKALRRAIGYCKHCHKTAEHLNICLEDYSLVARCISCGRNNLPEKLDTTNPDEAEHTERMLARRGIRKGVA